jgi:hypothetical protein
VSRNAPRDTFKDDHCDAEGNQQGSIANDSRQDRAERLFVGANGVQYTLMKVTKPLDTVPIDGLSQ